MVISSTTFGLPMLDENPFNPMPLEAGDEHKLIARDAEFLELKNYLKYQSPRRILLVGSFGSGRTSLLRCLQPYASTYASVEHLRVQGPGDALLRDASPVRELYARTLVLYARCDYISPTGLTGLLPKN